MKVRLITSESDLRELEDRIRISAETAVCSLRRLIDASTPLESLAAIRFGRVGVDPLEERDLNLVEQLNQMFTYLTSCLAVRYLMHEHPDAVPYRLNLGTAPGFDIESLDGRVGAEVFAATHPRSNGKLAKDAARLAASTFVEKYVFYSCAGIAAGQRPAIPRFPGVLVIALEPWTAP